MEHRFIETEESRAEDGRRMDDAAKARVADDKPFPTTDQVRRALAAYRLVKANAGE